MKAVVLVLGLLFIGCVNTCTRQANICNNWYVINIQKMDVLIEMEQNSPRVGIYIEERADLKRRLLRCFINRVPPAAFPLMYEFEE